ncbi:MAG: hypothetical protein ACXWR1_16620 [Bdellovibrionota bacterium]
MPKFRGLWLLTLLTACASHPLIGVPTDAEWQPLPVGTVVLVESSGPPIVSDPSVMEVVPRELPGQYSLVPLRLGRVSVRIPGKDELQRYSLVSGNVAAAMKSVSRLLSGIDGIAITAEDRNISVSGQLLHPETVLRDFDRILQVQDAYRDTVMVVVSLSDQLFETSARQMQAEIARVPGAEGVKVRWLNGTFLLEGEAADTAARGHAEAMVEVLLPPMQGSQAVKETILVMGARKYSIRNLVRVKEENRAPAALR